MHCKQMEQFLSEVLYTFMDENEDTLSDDETVKNINTFEEAMLLTNDKGIVVRMKDDSEFQITIVQSKRGKRNYDEDDEN